MNVGELFVKLSANLTRYEKDLETAQKKAKETGNSISNIFRNAVSFTIGQGMFELIRQGIKNAWDTSIGFNSQLQNNKIAFESLLGSAESANKKINELLSFAAKTPFETAGLFDASKKMLAMGFSADELLPSLKAIGDAMAGMGQGTEAVDGVIMALGQMRMAGRVNAQDMLQLVNRGVPAWQILADAMGKSTAEVRKMSEQGLIPAEFAVKALINGMEQRFPNMMSKMENSWQGVTSTIKDIWRQFIGEATNNLFEGIKGWLIGVRDFSSEFYNAFKQGGLGNAIKQTLGTDAFVVFEMIRISVASVINVLSTMFQFIMGHWNIFRPLAMGALMLATSIKIATIITSIATAITKGWQAVQLALNGTFAGTNLILGFVSRAVGIYNMQMALASMSGITLTGVLAKVRVALYSVWTALGPIGWLVLGISLLITAGYFVIKNWEAVKYYGLQAWGYLKTGILYAILGIINGMRGLAWIFPSLNKYFDKAINGIKSSIQNEKKILADRRQAYKNSAKAGNDAKKLTDGLAQITKQASQATDKNTSKINKNTQALKNRKRALQENLQSFDELHKIQQSSQSADGGTATPTLDNINAIPLPKLDGSNLFSSWDDIKKDLGNQWDDFSKKDTPSWWERIKNSISSKFGELKQSLANKWTDIKENIKTKWDNFKEDAGIKWEGIKNKVVTKYGELKTALANKWAEIKIGITTKWDEFKNTDVSTKWDAIKNKIVSKYGEVKSSLGTKWTEIKNDLVSKWNSFKNTEVDTKWNEIKKKITDKFTPATIPSTIKTWGQNLVSTLVDGIKSKWESIKKASAGLAQVIGDFLGFHSPTKEGAGSEADKWMPNFIDMYAQGLLKGKGQIRNAVDVLGGVVGRLNVVPSITPQITPSLAGVGALQVGTSYNNSSKNERPIEIKVQLGDRTIYKEIINGINDIQKQAGRTLIK